MVNSPSGFAYAVVRCSRLDGVTQDNYCIFNDGTKVPTPHPSAKLTPSPQRRRLSIHILFNSLTSPTVLDAINKKQSSAQYLADLEKIRKAYVQDVKEQYSDTTITQNPDVVNANSEKSTSAQSTEHTEKYDLQNDSIRITKDDVLAVQSIPRKSVNDFTSEEIKKTEKFAQRYFEKMGTKSPFFRAWFGDWRENDENSITVTLHNKNVSIPSSDVFNEDVGIKAFLGSLLKQKTTTHSKNKKSKDVRLWILSNSEDAFKNAVLLDSHVSHTGGHKSNQTVFMHSFYGVFDDSGNKCVYKFYVEEYLNEGEIQRRGYEIKDVKILPTSSRGSNVKTSFSQPEDVDNVNTISDLFQFVKQNDKNFNPKPASKITNEDGTPKIVYHGTENFGFTEFDLSKSDDNSTIFLTDSSELASTGTIPTIPGLKEAIYKKWSTASGPDDACIPRMYVHDAEKTHTPDNIVTEKSDFVKSDAEKCICKKYNKRNGRYFC